MPFRATIVPMWKFLTKTFPNVQFGYGMKGNTKLADEDNCILETVGYKRQTVGYMKKATRSL